MQDRIHAEIAQIRKELGSRLSIVAHHYQSDPIIRHADVIGDSLELARKVAALDSENIVFCGVNFMAESAALLARPGQKVFLPAPDAQCVMAKMVPADLLDIVLGKLNSNGRNVLPLAYVNTSVAVKAVVGRHGGAVCTSANAEKMMRWAYEQSDKVMFLPDKNLGNNTANRIGIAADARQVLDVRARGKHVSDSVDQSAKLLFWPGCCAIHAKFNQSVVSKLRAEYPGIKIAVHPECAPELVSAADASGSTSFLIKFAEEAPDGSVIAIGTEINLVERLVKLHEGRIKIVPLFVSACSDMAKTTPENLLACLRHVSGKSTAGDPVYTPVTIDPADAQPAVDSLTRMLEASK